MHQIEQTRTTTTTKVPTNTHAWLLIQKKNYKLKWKTQKYTHTFEQVAKEIQEIIRYFFF